MNGHSLQPRRGGMVGLRSQAFVLVLVGLFLASAVAVVAQEPEAQSTTGPVKGQKWFGFFVGPNWANMGADAEQFGLDLASMLESEIGGNWSSEKGGRTGFCIGFATTRVMSPTFSLRSEIQYIQRGVSYQLSESTTGLVMDMTLEYDYLEVPILGQIAPATKGQLAPFLVFGPVLGLNVTASLKAEAEGQSDATDMKDTTKSVYIGGLLGAGAVYRINPRTSLFLQARYMASFSNQVEDPTYSLKSGDFNLVFGMDFLSN